MKTQDIHAQPLIEVGILTHQKIEFLLHAPYQIRGLQVSRSDIIDAGSLPAGSYACVLQDDAILFQDILYKQLSFESEVDSARFELCRVRIGIDFHWEQEQNQCFEGDLLIKIENQALLAINRIALESYLHSVIASEMNARAHVEFLKAHAVISRSWLLAQLNLGSRATSGHAINAGTIESDKKPMAANQAAEEVFTPSLLDPEKPLERIRWYERDAHSLYDVCADDHCQRYQGILEADTPQVKTALRSTIGCVLSQEGEICDARFSKCCGGWTESFENCWADTKRSYLISKPDMIPGPDPEFLADPVHFILANPPSFCNTRDQTVLQQVLKDYDLKTRHFFRWTVRYGVEELSDLFRERSGFDLGLLSDLEALERGGSGRIVRLKVSGSKGSVIIGKELEIRRCLSPTHLYSSAFVVEKEKDAQGGLRAFVLRGAGWGHGVGLCQIGAAVMAEQGFSYQQILAHYYPNTIITQVYDR